MSYSWIMDPFPFSFFAFLLSDVFVGVAGLPVAWWLARSGGQPSSDWDTGPDWIKPEW